MIPLWVSLDLDILDVVSTLVGIDLEGLDSLDGAERSDGLDRSDWLNWADRLDGFNGLDGLETLEVGGILRGRTIELGDSVWGLDLNDNGVGSSRLLGTALLLRRLARLVLIVGVLAHVLSLGLSCLVEPDVLDTLRFTVPLRSDHTRCDLLASSM